MSDEARLGRPHTRKTKIADGFAWRWHAEPNPEGKYLAIATFFELRNGWGLPRFQWYSLRVHQQLTNTPGLIGHSVRGRFPTKYWTLSAWDAGRDLRDFIQAMPHAQAMTALPASMRRFQSVRWWVNGSGLPLAWSDGLARLDAEDQRKQTGDSPEVPPDALT